MTIFILQTSHGGHCKLFHMRRNLIKVYKIMYVMEEVDKDSFISLSHNTSCQGYPMKLTGNMSRTEKGKYF